MSTGRGVIQRSSLLMGHFVKIFIVYLIKKKFYTIVNVTFIIITNLQLYSPCLLQSILKSLSYAQYRPFLRCPPTSTLQFALCICESASLFLVTPWIVAHQVPQSVEFSSQGYWSVLPFLSPGDLPNLGIKPGSPAVQADSLLSEPTGEAPLYFLHSTYT